MKCEKCNNPLTGSENFCRICGTPVNKEKKETSEEKKLEMSANIDVTKIVVEKEKEEAASEKKEVDKDNNISDVNESDNEFLLLEDTSEQKIKDILEEFNKEDDEKNSSKEEDKVEEEPVKEEQDNKKKNSKKDKETKNKKEKEPEDVVEDNKKEDIKPEEEVVETEVKEDNSYNNEVANIFSNQEKSVELENNAPVNEVASATDVVEANEIPVVNNEIDNIPETNKKGRSVLPIIFIILLILVCIPLGYFTYMYFQTADELKDVKSKYNELEDKIDKLNKEKENSDHPVFVYNGYEISINSSDKVSINNGFVIYNDLEFAIGNGIKYNDLKNDLEGAKNTITKNKYSVNNYGKKVLENKEYIFFDTKTESGEKTLLIFTSVTESDTIVFVVPYSTDQPDFSKVDSCLNFISLLKKTNDLAFIENSLFN